VLVPKVLEALEGGTDGDGLPPDFDLGARGADLGPWLRRQHWEGPVRQKIEAVLAYALEHYPGVPISAVGVCWGGYAAFQLAGVHPSLHSIVIPHPSVHLEEAMYGGNNLELGAKVC
jgi:dienelactone hydrolase